MCVLRVHYLHLLVQLIAKSPLYADFTVKLKKNVESPLYTGLYNQYIEIYSQDNLHTQKFNVKSPLNTDFTVKPPQKKN